MFRNQTTFLTFRSTLFARCVEHAFRLVRTRLIEVQALVHAISQVRFENGKTPAVVRQFLVDQLRYNDNTANPVGVTGLQDKAQAH